MWQKRSIITLFLGSDKQTIIILKRKLISGLSIQNFCGCNYDVYEQWIYLCKSAIKINIVNLEILIRYYSETTKNKVCNRSATESVKSDNEIKTSMICLMWSNKYISTRDSVIIIYIILVTVPCVNLFELNFVHLFVVYLTTLCVGESVQRRNRFSSNFGPDRTYSFCGLSWIYSVTPGKCWDSISTRPRPLPFKSFPNNQ
jgi:hypothetical protein